MLINCSQESVNHVILMTTFNGCSIWVGNKRTPQCQAVCYAAHVARAGEYII